MYDVEQIAAEPLLLEPLRRAIAEDAPPAYLRSAKIKVTARCNLKCKMCRYGKGLSLPELPTERMLGILDELAGLGCRKVHFSGGEVFSRRDFEQLVGRAAERELKVTLTSNLTLLTKERAKALMRHRVRSISTSLDGARRKTHEAIRGVPGSFDKTLRALGYIARERERRRRKTRVRVNFTILRENFREYPGVIRLAGEHGASDVLPMPVDTKDDALRLSKRLIREYEAEIAPEVAALRQRYGMPMGERYVHPFGVASEQLEEAKRGDYAGGFYREHLCYAPWTHVFIAWDGEVFLCCMTNGRIEPLGELAHQSVAEVFHGPRFAAIRAQMKRERLPSCHQCDMVLEENRALAAVLPGPLSPGPIRPREDDARRALGVVG